MGLMSPRYLLHTHHRRKFPSISSCSDPLKTNPLFGKSKNQLTAITRTITVCAKDRTGLLSKLAGVLTISNINILDVRIFTWRNNVALDIFEVEAPADLIFEEERWQKTARKLEAALDNRLDISAELNQQLNSYKSIRKMTQNRPQKVVIDNETSSFFTIVEVYAWDFPGLLYRITDALFRCRLDIWVAKSASRIDQVVDVFYVRNFDGEKVDRQQEEDLIRKTVEAVLN